MDRGYEKLVHKHKNWKSSQLIQFRLIYNEKNTDKTCRLFFAIRLQRLRSLIIPGDDREFRNRHSHTSLIECNIGAHILTIRM